MDIQVYPLTGNDSTVMVPGVHAVAAVAARCSADLYPKNLTWETSNTAAYQVIYAYEC